MSHILSIRSLFGAVPCPATLIKNETRNGPLLSPNRKKTRIHQGSPGALIIHAEGLFDACEIMFQNKCGNLIQTVK